MNVGGVCCWMNRKEEDDDGGLLRALQSAVVKWHWSTTRTRGLPTWSWERIKEIPQSNILGLLGEGRPLSKSCTILVCTLYDRLYIG